MRAGFLLVLLTSWLPSLHYKQGHIAEGQPHCDQYIMTATNVPKAKTKYLCGSKLSQDIQKVKTKQIHTLFWCPI